MAIITSKLADIVAVRSAVAAKFLHLGAKDYFSDQITSRMKTGQTYSFVMPDAGTIAEGVSASPRSIDERKVDLSIVDVNNSVSTGAIEGVTDLKWDEEIATPYGNKLAQAVVKKAVKDSIPKSCFASIGKGFSALSQACAYVNSLNDGTNYGFIDPIAQATLTSNGQMFMPIGSPNNIYEKGLLGTFNSVEFDSCRFLPSVKVSQDFIDSISAAKFVAIDQAGTLTVSGLVANNATIPAHTPFFVAGAKACDSVGDSSNSDYAFITTRDVVISDTTMPLPVNPVITDDIGARMCDISDLVGGEDVTSFAGKGTYHLALIRADGAYDYTPVETLDIKLSNPTVGSVDSTKIFINSFTTGSDLSNLTRFDMPHMKGVVEPRMQAIAYMADASNSAY